MTKEPKEKGITGIQEIVRGFVRSSPEPHFDTTKNKGRPRVRFAVTIGKHNEDAGLYATTRYCVGYDQVAKTLSGLKPNDLVKLYGWVKTEAVLDDYYRPLRDGHGYVITREYLILYKAEIRQFERKPELQPALSGL